MTSVRALALFEPSEKEGLHAFHLLGFVALQAIEEVRTRASQSSIESILSLSSGQIESILQFCLESEFRNGMGIVNDDGIVDTVLTSACDRAHTYCQRMELVRGYKPFFVDEAAVSFLLTKIDTLKARLEGKAQRTERMAESLPSEAEQSREEVESVDSFENLSSVLEQVSLSPRAKQDEVLSVSSEDSDARTSTNSPVVMSEERHSDEVMSLDGDLDQNRKRDIAVDSLAFEMLSITAEDTQKAQQKGKVDNSSFDKSETVLLLSLLSSLKEQLQNAQGALNERKSVRLHSPQQPDSSTTPVFVTDTRKCVTVGTVQHHLSHLLESLQPDDPEGREPVRTSSSVSMKLLLGLVSTLVCELFRWRKSRTAAAKETPWERLVQERADLAWTEGAPLCFSDHFESR